jgi:mannose-1-phosphate guanylyltransferase
MARAMVLSAGLGTRLRPLTDELPKPLVPVGDQPILGHVLGWLRAHGYARAVVNTHHLPQEFATARLPLPVDLVHEPTIRGTAGGIAGARHLFDAAPIVVSNGDVLCEPPLGEFSRRATDGLCLAICPRPRGEGTVGIDAGGHVVRLRGELFGPEARGGDYLGVASLGARCLRTLPDQGCLIGDWALPELRRGVPVLTVDAPGPWTDCGDLERYLRANLDWLDGLGLDFWQGPGSEVGAGVELRRSIVGAGARVTGQGPVERSVIWPGARAVAPLFEVVVTHSGRVVPTAQG